MAEIKPWYELETRSGGRWIKSLKMGPIRERDLEHVMSWAPSLCLPWRLIKCERIKHGKGSTKGTKGKSK